LRNAICSDVISGKTSRKSKARRISTVVAHHEHVRDVLATLVGAFQARIPVLEEFLSCEVGVELSPSAVAVLSTVRKS